MAHRWTELQVSVLESATSIGLHSLGLDIKGVLVDDTPAEFELDRPDMGAAGGTCMTDFVTVKAAADKAFSTYQYQVAQERSQVGLKIKLPESVLHRPPEDVKVGGRGAAAGTPERASSVPPDAAADAQMSAPSPGPDLSIEDTPGGGGAMRGARGNGESTPPPHAQQPQSGAREEGRRMLSLRVAFIHGFPAAATSRPLPGGAGGDDGPLSTASASPPPTGALSFIGGEFAVTEQGGGAPRRARALFPCIDVQVRRRE